jgi:3-hydroxyacyl-CoA dehydrogenase
MAGDVTYSVDGAVAVVTINNPPVNAFGFDVRNGVIEAMNRAEADPDVTCVVLTGGGRTFSGGADITEFDKTPREPSLPDVNTRLRDPEQASGRGDPRLCLRRRA